MITKARLQARRDKYSGKSTFAYPPTLVGARTDDGMQWIEDGCIRERHRVWADEAADAVGRRRAIDHTGWFLSEFCDDGTYRGCVIMLSHGRFIAGYRDTDSDTGTRVDVMRTFYDEFDAAQYADECARIAAEREREYREGSSLAFTYSEALEAICAARKTHTLAIRKFLSADDAGTWRSVRDAFAMAMDCVREVRRLRREHGEGTLARLVAEHR